MLQNLQCLILGLTDLILGLWVPTTKRLQVLLGIKIYELINVDILMAIKSLKQEGVMENETPLLKS